MSRIARRNIVPVNQITPLTYRDGVTYIQMLTELSEYIKSILHPSLQHTVDQLVSDVETQMGKHHDQYVDGVQEFQRIHDAFMSDVNAKLMALNDGAVSDLVEDDTSLLGGVLRNIFTSREAFTELAGTIEYRQAKLKSEIEKTTQDLVSDNTEFQSAMRQQVDGLNQKIDAQYDDLVKEIHELMAGDSPTTTATMGAGSTVIAMVGSSTTTRGEYPYEFSRHVKNKYRGGMFARLDDLTNAATTNPPPGVHVINAGWGGSNAANYVDDSIATRISNMNPIMVIHGIGSNDWLHRRSPETVANDIDRAINRFTSSKPLYHVLVHQHSRTNVPSSNPYTWDMYLDALHDVASRGPRRLVVNTMDELTAMGVGPGLNDPYGLMHSDGTHLTKDGHDVLGRIVAQKLGFDRGGGQTDTGWKDVSDYVVFHPNTRQGTSEPVQIRIVSDPTGNTTYIRGVLGRSSSSTGLFTIDARYRNLIVPDMDYGEGNRTTIGTWWSVSNDRHRSGLVILRPTGGVVLVDPRGDAASVSVRLDLEIRA